VGDEGKAVGIAQAPAALLSPHNVTIRSVITITESPFFVTSRFKACAIPAPAGDCRAVLALMGSRSLFRLIWGGEQPLSLVRILLNACSY
jgi:hypothetical protein